MKAYLTFVRRKEEDVHMLGINNPSNISKIMFIGLIPATIAFSLKCFLI